MLTFGSLFAGIGGADIGLERAGFECRWQVEIDDYCNRVLKKHWPTVRRHRDVRTFPPMVKGIWHRSDWEVDAIVGGFPCQGISLAGYGGGLADERSGLWHEYARVVRLLRPNFVVIENSPAVVVRGLDTILCDLAASGFDAEWQIIQASDFTLPHRRERAFIVAYANGQYGTKRVGTKQNRTREIFDRGLRERIPIRVQAADHFVGVDDGIRGRAYRLRGKSIGNAIVPDVAEFIGRRIIEALT